MSDKELLIKELIVRDFNEMLVNEFCTDWKEKRLYIELLIRATHFDYLLNYIQEKDKENNRLNNVIDSIENEVRNTTEEMYKTLVKIDGRGYYSANLTRLDYLLDKIKKLKGVDKE